MLLLLTSTPTSYVDTTIVTEIGTTLGSVVGWITNNPMLMVFFTMSIIGMVIGLFKRLKKSVR